MAPVVWMHPSYQCMFTYFTEVLKLTILNAKKEGRYNEGMLDITASSVEMAKEPKNIFEELNKGHATTRLVELNIDRGMSWEMALTRLENHTGPHDGFYISRREMWGRKLCILATQKENSSHLFRIARPNTGLSMFEEEKSELMHKYVPLTKDKTENLWKELYAQSLDQCIHGKTCKHSKTCRVGSRCYRMHLLCGSIVSHMSLLEATLNRFSTKLNLSKSEATIRVVRVKLSNGDRVVGVRYPEVLVRQVEKVLAEQNKPWGASPMDQPQSNQNPITSYLTSSLETNNSSKKDQTDIVIKSEPGLDNNDMAVSEPSHNSSGRVYIEPITPVCEKSQRKAFRPPVTIRNFFKPPAEFVSSDWSEKNTDSVNIDEIGNNEENLHDVTNSGLKKEQKNESYAAIKPNSTTKRKAGNSLVEPTAKRQKQSSIMSSFAKAVSKKEETKNKGKVCPICQHKFDEGTSNVDINSHIDNCLIE